MEALRGPAPGTPGVAGTLWAGGAPAPGTPVEITEEDIELLKKPNPDLALFQQEAAEK